MIDSAFCINFWNARNEGSVERLLGKHQEAENGLWSFFGRNQQKNQLPFGMQKLG
jgi:hypothetical protein